MKRFRGWMVLPLLAALAAGCGVTAEQRRVHEHEEFLRQSMGDFSARYDRYSETAPRRSAAAAHDEHSG